jgi:hypothetical protein
VALIEVDVVNPQTGERRVDLLAHLHARETAIGVAHREVQLRREDVRVARPAGE